MSFNIINYNHELGYDAAAHKWYVEVLPFALPTDQDTYEFFSPPLPYIFPSLIDSVCDKLYELSQVNIDCTTLYGKSTIKPQKAMMGALMRKPSKQLRLVMKIFS